MQVLAGRSAPILRVPSPRAACDVHMHSLIQYIRRHLPSSGTVQTRAAKSAEQKVDQDRLVPKQNGRVRLAVVGDVHGQWTPADAAALRILGADAVLWVGESQLASSAEHMPRHLARLESLAQGAVRSCLFRPINSLLCTLLQVTLAMKTWVWCSRLQHW